MARDDDNTLLIAGVVGIGVYLIYQHLKSLCPPGATSLYDCICPGQTSLWGCLTNLNFGTGGAPGLLPMGAGGTAGGQGGVPGGTTGTGAPQPASSTLPSPAGAGGGQIQCRDDQTGQVVPLNADGTCPVGSSPWLAVTVSG